MFFAGLSWRLILPACWSVALGVTARSCRRRPDLPARRRMAGAARRTRSTASARCSTRRTDPLGKGFHIIQGMIAIGSGGIDGKGFMKGTQTHLEFIPERTTDFIFAAFAEEFGLVGAPLLLVASCS